MFFILHTDCVITCMFFWGLRASGISLVFAQTLTIGKTGPFLKVLMERCWLDLRNTASISSSSWGKQFCAVCFLGEAWENNMKMTSFPSQQAYLVLAGKRRNKGKVEALFFMACTKMPVCTTVSAFSLLSSNMTDYIKLCTGCCSGLGLDWESFQRMLTDICIDIQVDVLTLRYKWRISVCASWEWTEQTKRVEWGLKYKVAWKQAQILQRPTSTSTTPIFHPHDAVAAALFARSVPSVRLTRQMVICQPVICSVSAQKSALIATERQVKRSKPCCEAMSGAEGCELQLVV